MQGKNDCDNYSRICNTVQWEIRSGFVSLFKLNCVESTVFWSKKNPQNCKTQEEKTAKNAYISGIDGI